MIYIKILEIDLDLLEAISLSHIYILHLKFWMNQKILAAY